MILRVWWRWLAASVAGQRRTLSLLYRYARHSHACQQAHDAALRESGRVIAGLRAAHRADLAERDRTIADLRAENRSWQSLNGHLHDQLRAERSTSTRTYQRFGLVHVIADDPAMPPDLAARLRAVPYQTLPTLQGVPADD